MTGFKGFIEWKEQNAIILFKNHLIKRVEFSKIIDCKDEIIAKGA